MVLLLSKEIVNMSNQTVGPFESDEIDEYIKYNREYRFVTNNMYIVCIYMRTN